MGFLDMLGESIGSTVKKNLDSYNKVSGDYRTSDMSDEALYKKAKSAIERRDYGAAKAYGNEYKSRHNN